MINLNWNKMSHDTKYKLICAGLCTGIVCVFSSKLANIKKDQNESYVAEYEEDKNINDENDVIEEVIKDNEPVITDEKDNENIETEQLDVEEIEQPEEDSINHYCYIVKKDDSLDTLAVAFGCSVDDIINENGLEDTSLYINQELSIPYVKKDRNALVGIDVSHWNGDIDWDTTKDYVDYAIIRICDFYNKDQDGNYILDDKFKYNMDRCSELGIPVGVYAYSRALSEEDAEKEADFVLDTIKDYKIEYPVYFDIESQKQKEEIQNNLPNIINTTEAFCKKIEEANYYVGIYTCESIMQNLTKNSKYLNQFDKWIAKYEKKAEYFIDNVDESSISFPGQYLMQQSSSSVIVPGICGHTDVNFSYVDFPKIIKEAGLNNISSSKVR